MRKLLSTCRELVLCFDSRSPLVISKLFTVSVRGEGEIGVIFSCCLFIFSILFIAWLWFGEPDPASEIVFAGKIVNSTTREWPNNRLVLVFLKGKEVGRAVTTVGAFSESNRGTHDGLFIIRVRNIYRLKPDDFTSADNQSFPFQRDRAGRFSRDYIYQWFDELEEGNRISILIPSKNAQYSILSIPGDVSALPPEIMRAGSAELKADNQIVVSMPAPESTPGASSTDLRVQGVTYNQKTETIETNKLTIPINNCGGSSKITRDQMYTQSFLHTYSVEADAGVGAELSLPGGWTTLLLDLQTKYGFQQNQFEAKTESYHMEAEPGTNQVYVITWQEVWESGTAQVVKGSDVITIPFRVKTNLISSVDSSRMDCK
ncbi:MAG: hypothetical protein ACJ788_17500 [Ktedonobacteraceae bacterium]